MSISRSVGNTFLRPITIICCPGDSERAAIGYVDNDYISRTVFRLLASNYLADMKIEQRGKVWKFYPMRIYIYTLD